MHQLSDRVAPGAFEFQLDLARALHNSRQQLGVGLADIEHQQPRGRVEPVICDIEPNADSIVE